MGRQLSNRVPYKKVLQRASGGQNLKQISIALNLDHLYLRMNMQRYYRRARVQNLTHAVAQALRKKEIF